MAVSALVRLRAREAKSVGAKTVRARNRRFGPISALHTHTKAPYKTDLI
jgi:hypothetical protein